MTVKLHSTTLLSIKNIYNKCLILFKQNLSTNTREIQKMKKKAYNLIHCAHGVVFKNLINTFCLYYIHLY